MTDDRVDAWGYLEPKPTDPDNTTTEDTGFGPTRVRGASAFEVVDPVTNRTLETFSDEQAALEYAARENNAYIGELQVQEAPR